LQQALDYIQAHLEDVSLEAITTELGMDSITLPDSSNSLQVTLLPICD